MKTKLLAIWNVLLFLATIVVNFLANYLPIGGRDTWELSDMYVNLFVPAWFTFSIWGLIYLLLLWFVIRQLIDAFKKKWLWITNKVGIWFIVSSLANMWWIFAWHYTQVLLSLLIMLLILVSLIVISYKVEIGKKLWTWKDKLLVQVPFSVYLGWISVATIANVSIYLTTINWNMRWMTYVFRTVVVIVVAMLLGIAQLYKSYNVPYALVLIRAFYGIYSKRIEVDPEYAANIIWALGICSAILVWAISFRMNKWLKN